MAEERKSITLYIAQQPFKLSVPASQEEMYRRAESRIQEYTRQLVEKNNIGDKFVQLGYAAINFALNEIYLTDKQKFVDSDLKTNLRKIQEVIQMVLNDAEEKTP
jgi:cell division protein ZapA (FtsZ GTPase activity inhibitor)